MHLSFGNRINILPLLLILYMILTIQNSSIGDITPVSERTSQVLTAIVDAVPGTNTAEEVTDTQLAAITTLNLRNVGISELKSGDFSGLTGLSNLNLYGNELSSLPDGIFEGLTALTTLRLGGNTVDPLPIVVTLEKVGEDQIKAVVPTGAPYDIVLPISASNGNISDDTTSLTISIGTVESETVTVSRITDTTDAVTANIGTLPSLPNYHYGYTLSKSDALPLEIISAVSTAPETPEETETTTPTETTETTENTAPMFSDGSITTRFISENSAADINIGGVVSATDAENRTLTYSLSGVDADSFNLDDTTGQLKTKAALDYETKRIYTVIVNVSDGSLTDSITVVISIIDVGETPYVSTFLAVSERTSQVRDAIVAAVPGISVATNITDAHLATITSLSLRNIGITELKTGDFSGLIALTNLNLYGNMLSSLPIGIFDGLTSLTTLRIGGNLVDPLPLIVSLQQVAENQFQTVVHTAAPFNIVLPIEVTNGSLSDGGTTGTIVQGNLKSPVFTIVPSNQTSTSTVTIGELPELPTNHYGYILAKSAVCNRTTQVADAIAAAVLGTSDCQNVTDADLALITSLDLSDMSITSLDSNDFLGLYSLTTLNLSNNQLQRLPNGFFSDLTSLTSLNLDGNTVDPLQLTISMEKVGENQVKVVIPTGAPYDIVLPITVTNGSLPNGMTTITIPKTDVESQAVTITRTQGTTGAVTVDFGILPTLPSSHSGYALSKTNENPLEIFAPLNTAPVFTEGESTTRSIAENTDLGINIGSPVMATDEDNDTLLYRLGGTDAASFDIDTTNGQLLTKVSLDYETKSSYSVTISVSDDSLTSTIEVTIEITDVIENRRPVFSEGTSATRIVPENTGSGVDIGSPVSATDADDDTLTYSLSGTDGASFSIDSSTGQLRTNATLDYETKSSYSITITVSDSELTNSIDIMINITDVDETTIDVKDDTKSNNPPVFKEGVSTTRAIAENTGSGIDIGGTVSATDADNDTLTYSLSGIDATSFSIDSSSGQLRTNASLDYETKPSYTVTITVSDGNEGTDSITVTINVTDVDEIINSAPVFTEDDSTSRTIAENTGSGVDIGSAVSATDVDDDTLTYSLDGTDASSFSIDSSSGQLRTRVSLDYETKSLYTVTVTVSDEKDASDSITVTINVTDVDERPVNNDPVFTDGTSTSRTIAENTSSGIDIGSTISATDVDDDTLTYSLSGNDASSFSIDTGSGQLQTSASLDYETTTSYEVTVSVSDGQGGNASITVTINISNINEAPTFQDGTSTIRSIAENAGTNINIGSAVSASDEDGDTLTYTLDGTDADSFSIEPTSGQLKTKSALDYETKASYSVAITVTDGTLTDSITVTINVRDLDETPSNIAPEFTDGEETTRTIPENTTPDNEIGSAITATDEDSENLVYLLSGTDASSFSIDTDTGQLITSAALNYEEKTSYEVTVTVSDGTLEDEITVTINVTNVNEAPTFNDGENTSRFVDENTTIGTPFGRVVEATDPDADDTLTYSLSGTDADSFDIVSTTGKLQTKEALDYETKDDYSVTVIATDSGEATDTISVTIRVRDVDENRAPVFDDTDNTREIPENTGTGVNIGDPVEADDPDTGDTLEYTLSGTNATSFSIDSTSGQLRTHVALDYEDKDMYTVIVSVTDGNGGTDQITITINVTDVHENRAPTYNNATTTREVAENTGTGLDFGDPVQATDPDTNDTLKYSLGGTDATDFSIDSTSGQLRTNAPLDYETKSSYTLTVTATDTSDETAQITVNISVTDVNEAPSFSESSPTSRPIAEETSQGVNIGEPVAATDPEGDSLTYSLSGTNSDSFSIVPTSGQLQTKAALDYETKSSYSVTVTVTDDSLTDTIEVTINVTDVTENRAPEFSLSATFFRISDIESVSAGDNIGTAFTATDPDNDTLSYSLDATDADASLFDIVSSSGQLQATTSLINDSRSTYSITIIANDNNGGTDSIDVTVYVTRVSQQVTNNAPEFEDGTSTTRYIAENTASGVNIGDPISATDDDTGDTLTYSLSGTNATSFSIVSTTGQLQTSAALDYETKTSYEVTVTVMDDSEASNNSATITVTINITDVDEGITPVSDRTAAVQDAIVDAIDDVDNADDVTEEHLAAITSLNLSRKSLTTLSSGDFDGLTNLTSLNLFLNKLTSLPVNIFEDLTSLITLDLSGNNDVSTMPFTGYLTSIPDGIFDNTTALQNLDLSFNGLTSLPEDIFDGLSSLKTLDLTQNEFSTLPAGVFDGLTALEELEMYIQPKYAANLLTALPDGIFDDLTSLIDLELAGHNIQSLPANVFDQNTSIKYLSLNANKISSLSAGVFDKLTALERLHLGANQLTSLPDDVFDQNTMLKRLTLYSNSISSLHAGLFDNLTNLENIHLGFNELTSLPDDLFQNNTKLTHLDITYNSITSLQSDIFSELTELTNLYINSNNLSSLPDGLLVGLTKLSSFECGFQGEDDINMSIPVTFEKVAEGQFKIVCPIGMPTPHNRYTFIITNGTVHPDEFDGPPDINRIPDLVIPVGASESGIVDVIREEGTTDAVTINLFAVLYGVSIYNHGYNLIINNEQLPLELIPAVSGAPNNNTQLIPENTALLSNYPNPFNPETWIPYQLSKAADVTLTFYNSEGQVIRKLALGQKPAGFYTNRNRAAYWDGRNTVGEKVAAGIYFCTFKAGEFTATQKMLIRK